MRRRAGLGPLMAARSPSDRHRHRMSPPDPLRTLASGSSASAKHAASKMFFSGVRVRSIRQIAMLMIWCRRAIR
jgi:hypothetical protein